MVSLTDPALTERMTDTKTQATLVLGGTGKTGRRVAQRLTTLGRPVRVGSRSGRPRFDWQDQATWTPALDDVTAVYVSYYPDLAIPGAVEAVGSFAELAVRRDVPRLVLLAQLVIVLAACASGTKSRPRQSSTSRTRLAGMMP